MDQVQMQLLNDSWNYQNGGREGALWYIITREPLRRDFLKTSYLSVLTYSSLHLSSLNFEALFVHLNVNSQGVVILE